MQKSDKSKAEFKQEFIIYTGFSLTSIIVGAVLLVQSKFDFAFSIPLGFFFLCFPVVLLLNFLRVQYQQERRRGAFLNSILSTTPNVIFVFDWNTRSTQLINDGFPTLGYSDQEIDDLGPTLLSAIAPQDEQAGIMASFQNTYMNNDVHSKSYEWKLRAKDGSIHTFKVSQSDLSRDKNNPVIIAFAEDVTTQKNLEQTVEHDQKYIKKIEKYSALGNLSAGITHEMNNLLAIIHSTAEVTKVKIARGKAILEDMGPVFDKIMNNVHKISKTVTTLRLLTTENVSTEKQSVLVSTIIDDIEVIWAQRLKNHGFEFSVESPKAELAIVANRAALVTALFNLISNSFEHLNKKDVKWIKLESSLFDQNHVDISVTDSGGGISKAMKDKIFEPFFTTKTGAGSGLGLSLVKETVLNCDGTFFLDEASPNTKFVMRIPCKIEDFEHQADIAS